MELSKITQAVTEKDVKLITAMQVAYRSLYEAIGSNKFKKWLKSIEKG